ncbi:MAG: Hsp20/alpha crystallin family protein [Elusimicrobiota bacterium]|nr:Hsp20/alpha crystallin family protein [Elusimicrobiota bacterium]
MNEKSLMERTRETEAWDPFRGFGLPLGGLFEDFTLPMRMPAMPPMPKAWVPRLDIQETEKDFVLSVALPGVRKEDVRIEVKDDVLTLAGERRHEKEEKGRSWLRRETSYGGFQRSLVLPEGVHPEEVKAAYKDGILTVTIAKPAQARSRGVSVKVD